MRARNCQGSQNKLWQIDNCDVPVRTATAEDLGPESQGSHAQAQQAHSFA